MFDLKGAHWRSRRLKPTHKLVLAYLATQASEEGICIDRTPEIALNTGMKPEAVEQALGSLRRLGWIERPLAFSMVIRVPE